MNFSGYRYYKLNYEILKFLRLWNTEPKTPEVLLRLVLLYSFLMGSVVQVAALCMNEYSVTEMCRIVIFIHCSYSFFNKYLMLYVHIKKVKFLFARVEQDWNRLDNMDEYDILKRYTESSKLVRTIFILFAVPGSLVTVMYGYAPIVLDLLMPLNESRPRRFLFAVEFFVIDPIEHFMSINTILTIIIFLGVATMTIIDGSVVMFIMHNCAMFKIAGTVPGFRGAMDELLSEHHKLIKFLLSAVGLWPYERTYFVYVKRVAYALLVLSGIVFQLAAFLHDAVYNQNTIVTFMTNITVIVIVMYRHTSCLYRIEFLKELCDTITHHRTSITDENERRIIFTHIADVNAKNRSFAIIFYLSVCGYLLYDLLTNDYNNFKDGLDINIKMYYFTDNPKFSYVLHLHSILLMVLGVAGLVGPELATVTFAHHACTLFQIVRYRVKTAFVESSGMSDFEKDQLAMDKLISATKLHKVTIKYAGQLSKCLSNSYFLLMMLGVLSFSLNLLRVSMVMLSGNVEVVTFRTKCLDFDPESNTFMKHADGSVATATRGTERVDSPINVDICAYNVPVSGKLYLTNTAVIVGHFLYIGLTNHLGQMIINNGAEFFSDTYAGTWYTATVPAQKLLLSIMCHSKNDIVYVLGGIFRPSYEGFTAMTKLAVSYLMVIYRIRSTVDTAARLASTDPIDIGPAVDMHNRAHESLYYCFITCTMHLTLRICNKRLVITFGKNVLISYMLAILAVVGSFAVNLYRVFLSITENYSPVETFVPILVTQIHLLIMALNNYSGQSVIDTSSQIFIEAYNSVWYLIPPKSQKMLLLVLTKSMTATKINVAGLFVPSYEGFATVIEHIFLCRVFNTLQSDSGNFCCR
ncbi:uncharacterized protein LOC143212914 [Lasioglossum baleicum]|uniref:uncharacterized protein LOC143212914 n=1 Tax=Lasioglossum baleicum TaxID=434251 RepID=UPI003FCEC2BD